MARGDHLSVDRGAYTHHGIDLGDGSVIHLTGEPFAREGAEVRRTSLEAFARGGRVWIVSCACRSHDAERTVARAAGMLGDARYDLAVWNCEHFARWCRCGQARSRQVEHVAAILSPHAPIVARLAGECLAPACSDAPAGRGGSSDVGDTLVAVGSTLLLGGLLGMFL